jgi:uncharacterized small protein (DUF1192 family)
MSSGQGFLEGSVTQNAMDERFAAAMLKRPLIPQSSARVQEPAQQQIAELQAEVHRLRAEKSQLEATITLALELVEKEQLRANLYEGVVKRQLFL